MLDIVKTGHQRKRATTITAQVTVQAQLWAPAGDGNHSGSGGPSFGTLRGRPTIFTASVRQQRGYQYRGRLDSADKVDRGSYKFLRSLAESVGASRLKPGWLRRNNPPKLYTRLRPPDDRSSRTSQPFPNIFVALPTLASWPVVDMSREQLCTCQSDTFSFQDVTWKGDGIDDPITDFEATKVEQIN